MLDSGSNRDSVHIGTVRRSPVSCGEDLAGSALVMSIKKTVDRRPGPVPEIRADGDNVTFRIEVAGMPERTRLVLRCDASGEVWAAIVSGPSIP
jgi:hypothetical protein